MSPTIQEKTRIVIKFAGDSGDGMQLTGNQFSSNTALTGSDIVTFPDYPAEIRAPQGTLAGVSGFQIQFSSEDIFTPGDEIDVLVAMNAAALKINLPYLKKHGVIIVNNSGFDKRNLRLAGYQENPLEDGSLDNYRLIAIDITKLTREVLNDSSLGIKERDRSKNMFVLGFLFWMYDRKLDSTIAFLKEKFAKKPELLRANIKVLKAGYNFGVTTDTFSVRFKVDPADLPPGTYRGIMGNVATSYGLLAASEKAGLPLYLGSYPITPASDILHELAAKKQYGVRAFQAEDEIAAVSSAIGASFGGHLAVTTTSGPGFALKSEAIGLAVMLELPLVIINVQRAGPSTGMPTKTEQADLMQAYWGRNGESPVPILAAQSPTDCFDIAFEACRIAIEHMTPVIMLSDGYLANGSEPWRFPKMADLPPIKPVFAKPLNNGNERFYPYVRDEKLARPWAIPGTKGLEHRIGGLEKENLTGNVSYDPQNHEDMVKLRQEKIERIANYIPEQQIEEGDESGKLLVIGWGSTYGPIRSVVRDMHEEGIRGIGHAHLRYINPFPRNLGEIISRYEKVLVPEMNNGQLVRILRDHFSVPVVAYNKIQGIPFTLQEIRSKIEEIINP